MFSASVPWLIAYGLPATVSPAARVRTPVKLSVKASDPEVIWYVNGVGSVPLSLL